VISFQYMASDIAIPLSVGARILAR
jgi:hypothetical protein